MSKQKDAQMSAAQIKWLSHAASNYGCGRGTIANRTALSLESKGLARIKWYNSGIGYWVITDAGRVILADSTN